MSDKIPWKDLADTFVPALEGVQHGLGRLLWWKRFGRLQELGRKLVNEGAVSGNAWFLAQASRGGRVLIIDTHRELVFLHDAGYQKIYRPSDIIEYELKIDKRAVELAIVVLDPKHPSYEFWGSGPKTKTIFRHGRGLLLYLKSVHETDKR